MTPAHADDGRGQPDFVSEWSKLRRTRNVPAKYATLLKAVSSGTVDALDLVLSALSEPGDDTIYLRELIAPKVAEHFAGVEHAANIRAYIRTAGDYWMAYNMCLHWPSHGSGHLVTDASRDSGDVRLRIAAMHARQRSGGGLRDAADALSRLPESADDLNLMACACAQLLLHELCDPERSTDLGDERTALAISRLIDTLEVEKLESRSRTVISKALARILASRVLHSDAHSWRSLLDEYRARSRRQRDGYAADSGVTFARLPLLTKSIVYVIDMSGSMWDPFESGKREDGEPDLPASGKPGAPGAERRTADPFEVMEGVRAGKRARRIDLAKQALIASISSLDKDTGFAVVVFSTNAKLLDSTPAIVAASKSNVEKAIKSIDRLHPDGGTNLHEGLALALSLSEPQKTPTSGPKAPTRDRSSVQMPPADTIVLLTDGMPTVDRFALAQGAQGFEDSRESPYVRFGGENIFYAVERATLFNPVELNTVGIGEANRELLAEISRVTSGGTIIH